MFWHKLIFAINLDKTIVLNKIIFTAKTLENLTWTKYQQINFLNELLTYNPFHLKCHNSLLQFILACQIGIPQVFAECLISFDDRACQY